MSWSSRRQSFYFFGFVLILLVVIGVPVFFALYDPPTCSDGKHNGAEEGVDCGGECERVCPFQAADPIVQWARAFEVAPGVYTAVALVENPNAAYEAGNASYAFKLRDSQGVLVAEINGTVALSPKKEIPILQTGIRTGERQAVRAEFEWTSPLVWIEREQWDIPVEVTERRLENASTSPRALATLANTSTQTILNFSVIAVLYDAEGNALHASRTVVDAIAPRSEAQIVFTWPQLFPRPVAKIELYPLYD